MQISLRAASYQQVSRKLFSIVCPEPSLCQPLTKMTSQINFSFHSSLVLILWLMTGLYTRCYGKTLFLKAVCSLFTGTYLDSIRHKLLINIVIFCFLFWGCLFWFGWQRCPHIMLCWRHEVWRFKGIKWETAHHLIVSIIYTINGATL